MDHRPFDGATKRRAPTCWLAISELKGRVAEEGLDAVVVAVIDRLGQTEHEVGDLALRAGTLAAIYLDSSAASSNASASSSTTTRSTFREEHKAGDEGQTHQAGRGRQRGTNPFDKRIVRGIDHSVDAGGRHVGDRLTGPDEPHYRAWIRGIDDVGDCLLSLRSIRDHTFELGRQRCARRPRPGCCP